MIYVVSHKPAVPPALDGCRPIQVGYAEEDYPGFLRDDTGDNIALKNETYCELTALYWIWKNARDSFKGMMHYRRRFARNLLGVGPDCLCGEKRLREALGGCDLVVARPAVYHVDAHRQLCLESCSEATFSALMGAVRAVHPECMPAFERFFRGNRASQYNMLYGRAEVFDAYCAWLFDILFETERRVDVGALRGYQRRVFGFLGERLLNVWILHNDLRVRTLPVVNLEDGLGRRLVYLRRDVTNDIRFHLARLAGRG